MNEEGAGEEGRGRGRQEGGEATGSFSRPFVRTPPGFRARTGPPKETGGHWPRGESISQGASGPRALKTPPPEGAPPPAPTPPPPGGFGGRAHLGRGAKVSGAGVRTGGKGAGAPYSSARGQCRRGGSLEPPGRGASGAGGLLGQKVLREQLLRPPSAQPLGDAPPPAFTGHAAPPPRPRPRGTWSAQARPCPAHRCGLRLRHASERTSARPPVLARDSRARARLSPPPHPPPPAIRLNVARARSGGSSDRYAGRGLLGQRAGADVRLGLAASPSLARCAQEREGPAAELPGHPELPAKSLHTHLSRLEGGGAQFLRFSSSVSGVEEMTRLKWFKESS